jgi:hypothetical protein
MDNKIAGGLIGVLTLLLAFGGTIYLTQEQQNMAYSCSTTNQVYLCESLSSTNKTCYWTVNATKKSATCTNGFFTKIYFGPTELPPPVIISPEPSGIQYYCNQYNCTRIR